MDFVFDELRKALSEVMNEGPGWRSELEARKAQVEDELENLALAIRQGAPAKTLRKSLADGERELARLTAKLKEPKPIDLNAELDDMRKFALSKIASLPMLFREEPSATPVGSFGSG